MRSILRQSIKVFTCGAFFMSSLRLLVGLGNPEPRYELTRHNAGFMFIQKIATKYGVTPLSFNSRMEAEIGKCKIAGKDVMLARPTTYMNLSGKAVQAIMAFYKIDRPDLMVVHDEVALPMGKIRLARGGGSAGNHGIESIMEYLGHTEFERLRIGVGPDPGGAIRAHFVLSTIADADLELYYKSISLAIDAAEMSLQEGIQVAMNKFNGMDLR